MKGNSFKPYWKAGSRHKDDVFRQIYNICMIPRFLGLFPFVLKENSFRLSQTRLIVTVLHLILALSLAFYSVGEFRFAADRKLIYTLTVLLSLGGYLASPFALVFPLARVDQLNRSLSCIYLVDLQLDRLDRSRESRADCASCSYRSFHWFIIALMFLLRIWFIALEHFLLNVSFLWPVALVTVTLDQIICILNVLSSRLDIILTAAEDLLASHLDLKKLEVLSRCHDLLCTCGTLMNNIYSESFLLLCTSSFTAIVCELYIAYYYTIPHRLDVVNVCVRIWWVIFGTLVLCRLTSCCATVTERASKFNDLLFKALIFNKSNEDVSDLKMRLHIDQKPGIVFNACDLFNVDYTLVSSVFAAAATYLIILIQFDDPNSKS